MTVREMQILFDTLVQQVSDTMEVKEKPDSFTIVNFLRLAEEKYINDNFLSGSNLQDNIEYIQKRSDTLRNLISRYTPTASGTPITPTEADGGIALELPDDYLYYIKSFSLATNTLTNTVSPTWTPNRVINHNELDMITNGIYNKPILRKPCVIFEADENVILYHDNDTSIYNINYIYLRKPLVMTLEATGVNTPAGYTNVCELDTYTHREIVQMAVSLFLDDYKLKLAQR